MTTRRFCLNLLLLSVPLFIGGRSAYAQTAEVTSRATDANAAVVQGLEIGITHTATAITRKSVTNDEDYSECAARTAVEFAYRRCLRGQSRRTA